MVQAVEGMNREIQIPRIFVCHGIVCRCYSGVRLAPFLKTKEKLDLDEVLLLEPASLGCFEIELMFWQNRCHVERLFRSVFEFEQKSPVLHMNFIQYV